MPLKLPVQVAAGTLDAKIDLSFVGHGRDPPQLTLAGTARLAELAVNERSGRPLLRVPSLILQCTDDMIAPNAVGEYVHRQIAGSHLVKLAATGHCPNLSAPSETIAAIRNGAAAPGPDARDRP